MGSVCLPIAGGVPWPGSRQMSAAVRASSSTARHSTHAAWPGDDWHHGDVARGRGTGPGRAVAAAALLLGLLALSASAGAAAYPTSGPKPDPPPKSKPPPPPPPQPPPASRPQPVAPQPVAPPPVALAPVVTGPTTAERQATARKAAWAKAARVARARRTAALKRAALARHRERAQAVPSVPAAATASSSALPYLLAAFTVALLMLGLALTPARAVPWSRAARVLDDRRDEFGVVGAMSIVATVLFFLLVQVTK